MADFAKIGLNGKVISVHSIHDDVLKDADGNVQEILGINFLTNRTGWAEWRQTFKDGTRKNYAGPGYTYDENRDAFIPPNNYPSWVLKKPEYVWESPVGDPPETYTKNLKQRDGITPLGDFYVWNDLHQRWEIKD